MISYIDRTGVVDVVVVVRWSNNDILGRVHDDTKLHPLPVHSYCDGCWVEEEDESHHH